MYEKGNTIKTCACIKAFHISNPEKAIINNNSSKQKKSK